LSRTVAVRPHGIFGENDPGVIHGLNEAGKRSKLRFMIGDGSNIVDFTYVTNVSWGLILAGEHLSSGVAAGQAYHITNREPIKFWTFVDKFCQKMEYSRPRYSIPYLLLVFIAWLMELLFGENASINLKTIRLGGLHHWYSCEKATEQLGYYPLVSLEDGLSRSCSSLRAGAA